MDDSSFRPTEGLSLGLPLHLGGHRPAAGSSSFRAAGNLSAIAEFGTRGQRRSCRTSEPSSTGGQAVTNDQLRVRNWTHLPPLTACT
jgi:hypothetical protein